MHARADHIIALYQTLAAQFIADRGEVLGAERGWLTRFADGLPARASVLDIGCGFAGPMASYLIERGFMVQGVDASSTLIAAARKRHPGYLWSVADMRGLDLRRRFDGLLGWDSFFHLTHADQRLMFAVFQRHAAPGALLMFNSGPAHGEAIGSYHGQALYHASLAPAEYRQLLVAHGFDEMAYIAEDPGCGGRSVWLARARD